MKQASGEDVSIQAFERAAELFGLLSTSVRLRIVSTLCQGEKNVGELSAVMDVAQPNISQHLSMLYRSGVLAKRKSGTQVFYRIADECSGLVCRAVCSQLQATEVLAAAGRFH
ncbi:MAG: Biofilm growth-associated repressor [Pseudomonadota bacterium]|jgi:ArsR family transcriptional regulator